MNDTPQPQLTPGDELELELRTQLAGLHAYAQDMGAFAADLDRRLTTLTLTSLLLAACIGMLWAGLKERKQ